MKLDINPNRMELFKLQKKITLAKKGHKLLKDKQDELIKHFFSIIEKWKKIREEMENKLNDFYKSSQIIDSIQDKKITEEIFLNSKNDFLLNINFKKIMNLSVPEFQTTFAKDDIFNFSFRETSGEMDIMVIKLLKLYPVMINLAEIETKIELLSYEIEKTRRRVNALEYVLIPNFQETIKHIAMRLNEIERSNLTRLMKVKKMVEKIRRGC
ncbi:MAG: V-type ATP synthase subunit D [bacterium]